MRAYRVAIICCALAASVEPAPGQAEFRVYREHPRLFLEPTRLDRLRKDAARQSLRWESLQALVDAGSAFPEQPLVDALRYQVEDADEPGLRAVAWSRGIAANSIRDASELRLAALVYDWCHGLFEPAGRDALRNAMAEAVGLLLPQANLEPGLLRSGILAAIALANDWEGSENALAILLGKHWAEEISPRLEAGGLTDDGAVLIAVLETTLAVRHNLETDLLRPATNAVASLVRTRLLSYYPLDIQTEEGLARRPSQFGTDELKAKRQAPLYRLADLLLVAYEANLREFQFLQGWIRDDNYQLNSPLAAPYEFLWVNPYLPGLTPQSAPRLAHDPVRGRLYGRFEWQRPTTWIAYMDASLQVLADGSLAASTEFGGLEPMYFPKAVVVPVQARSKVTLSWQPSREDAPDDARIYLIGLKPGETYALRVGGRPPRLVEAGAGGILMLRNNPDSPRRDRIDLRKKVRLELRPTLKPTAPGRSRPTLRP